ncbi:MAG: hypothetical protein ACLGIG_00200 [Actinomycetes bacterium]
MTRTDGAETVSGEARERRLAREALLADRAAAALTRSRRRVGLRAPAALPVAVRASRGLLAPGRPQRGAA